VADVDFIIAFVIIFSVIGFLIFYSSNYVENQISVVQNQELEAQSNLISSYILDRGSDYSLVSDLEIIAMDFKEIGGYGHTEEVKISVVAPSVEYAAVYDKFLNEIPSSVLLSGSGADINFPVPLTANQSIRLGIYYIGDSVQDVVDTTDETQNITTTVVKGQSLDIIKSTKCTEFQVMGYENIKQNLGINRDFNITYPGCSFGLVPNEYDVYSIEKSMLIQTSAGDIDSGTVKLLVW